MFCFFYLTHVVAYPRNEMFAINCNVMKCTYIKPGNSVCRYKFYYVRSHHICPHMASYEFISSSSKNMIDIWLMAVFFPDIQITLLHPRYSKIGLQAYAV